MRKRFYILLHGIAFLCYCITTGRAQCDNWQLLPDNLFIPCGTTCVNTTATVPQYKTTDNYRAEEISYQPLAFSAPGGVELTGLYAADNRFSNVQQIGFPISFYGNNYTSFVVGNNGVVSFDASLAGCTNAALLTNNGQPQTLPYAGGIACGPAGNAYYPRAAAMLYHNLDASAPGGPNKRIEWRTEGAAPCRKLIISFTEVALEGNYCGRLWSSFQMVFYEHSGMVDFFIKDKPTCANNNENLGILGLQNATQTAAVTAPGKNTTRFSEQQTAYRFVPDGGGTLWQSAVLLKNGVPQAALQTSNPVVNEMRLTFAAYCFNPARDSLQLLATYKTATGLSNFTLSDTVFLNKDVNAFNFTTTTTPSICQNANGAIAVNLPPLANPLQYLYQLDQAPFQNGLQFNNLVPGSYLVTVKDLSGTCVAQNTVLVADTNPLRVEYDIINATCQGIPNGAITVLATNGQAPYQYSFNNNGFVSTNVFGNLVPGTYTIRVKDALGCERFEEVAVRPGTPLNFTASTTPAFCDVATNGSLSVQIISGTAPYQYALGSGSFQASPFFNQLPAGPNVITVKDAAGCQLTLAVDVPIGPGIGATATVVNASCLTTNNGSITVTGNSGTAPYLYSFGGGPFQLSGTFPNLYAGNYNITVKDDNGCTTTISRNVNAAQGMIVDMALTPPTCSVTNNGSIVVTVSGGQPPYQYSINNGPYQASNIFTGLLPNYYIITVKDAAGCFNSIARELLPGEPFDYTMTATKNTCTNDTAYITINVITPTAVPPFQYAATPTGNPVYQNSNVITVLGEGIYLVYVKDGNGCVVIKAIVVERENPISFFTDVTNSSCNFSADGIIDVQSNNNAGYLFSLSGGAPSPNNVFTGLAPGSYNVVVSYELCADDMDVSVAPGPKISVSAQATPESCGGISDGIITMTANTGRPPIKYALGISTNYQLNNVFTGLPAGNYRVKAMDALGCTDTVDVFVPETELFTFDWTLVNPPCAESNNGSITINTSPAGVYEYSINNGPFQAGNVFSNLFAASYRIAVRNAAGCLRSQQVTLTAGTGLSATADVTAPITCVRSTGTVVINVTNATPPVMVSMNNGPYQNMTTFGNLPPGNYIFRIRDFNGCTAIRNASLSIPQRPVMNLLTTRPCNGKADGEIEADITGGNPPFAFSVNGAPPVSNNIFSLGGGTYTIRVTDALDCAVEKTVPLIQYSPLTLNALVKHAGCTGSEAGSITLQPRGEGSIFEYSVNNGVFNNSNPISQLAGTYQIVAKDEFGCKSPPLTVTLGIKNSISLNTLPDTELCEGVPFTLTTTSNADSFLWRPGLYLNDSTVQSPVITPFASGLYTVTARLGDCQLNRFVNITLKPTPIADAGPDTMVCFGQPWMLQGSGGVAYRWQPAAGLTNANIANPFFTGNQTAAYSLSVRGANGCTSLKEDSVTITRLAPVPVFAGVDTLVLAGKPHQLQGSGGFTYTWQPPDYLSNANIANPLTTLTQDQRYTLRVIDSNGCSASDDISLKIYRPFIFPEAFTPNNDGVNDVFTEASGNSLRNYVLRVYNRYGQLIFESRSPQQGWNGRVKGVPQDGGTYVFQAEAYDGYLKQQVKLKGTVVLIR
jgi:large repetitive protein